MERRDDEEQQHQAQGAPSGSSAAASSRLQVLAGQLKPSSACARLLLERVRGKEQRLRNHLTRTTTPGAGVA